MIDIISTIIWDRYFTVRRTAEQTARSVIKELRR